ncbi:signal recognition particle protein Srp19 [archaeon]|nr:signal recognition particle protein Srp19 [archaeon]
MTTVVVWPAYIDAEKSKAEGRKIPKKLAPASPTLKEIEAAAKDLGYHIKTEHDKAYPKAWWEKSGRITLEKKKAKTLILKELAKEIKKKRD